MRTTGLSGSIVERVMFTSPGEPAAGIDIAECPDHRWVRAPRESEAVFRERAKAEARAAGFTRIVFLGIFDTTATN